MYTIKFQLINKINPARKYTYEDIRDVFENNHIPGVKIINSDNGFIVKCNGYQLNIFDNHGSVMIIFIHPGVPDAFYLKNIIRMMERVANILNCKVTPYIDPVQDLLNRQYFIESLTKHKSNEPSPVFTQEEIDETDDIWNSMTPRQIDLMMARRRNTWGFRKPKRVKTAIVRKSKKVVKKCKCKK